MVASKSIQCECGGFYKGNSSYDRKLHSQSRKHKKYEESGIKFSVLFKHNANDEENIMKRREYYRNYYSNHKEIWMKKPKIDNIITNIIFIDDENENDIINLYEC